VAIELNYSSHPAHRLSRIVIAALAVALMTLAGGGGHGKAAAQVALAQLSLMLAWTAAIYVRRHGRSVRGSWLATLAWMTSVLAISLTCYQPICRILQAIPPIWGKNLPTAQAAAEVQHLLGGLSISIPAPGPGQPRVRGYIKGDSAYRKWYRVPLRPQEAAKLQAALLAKIKAVPEDPKSEGPFLHEDFRKSDLLMDSPGWWKARQLDDADCFVLDRMRYVLSVKRGEVYIFLSRFW
jgi:hypothetical protein